MSYKQPRSVQVVIFAEREKQREFLLLKRVAHHGGFWQPVTGALEEGETHRQAAVREVLEETGIVCRAEDLIDLNLTNIFEIAPQWRSKFAPDVTHNEEVCFALKAQKCDVRLDTLEHLDYSWVDYEQAFAMLYWDSSKKAFASVAEFLVRQGDGEKGRKGDRETI